jgi:hypothetical protein
VVLIHAVHVEEVVRREEVQVQGGRRHYWVGSDSVTGDELGGEEDRTEDIIVCAVVLVLVQLAELEGLKEMGVEF